MESVRNELHMRKIQLEQWKKQKEKELIKAPEGSLRVCRHGKKIQYYHRKDPKDFNGIYIREQDIELARKLVQKDYDERVLKSVKKELDVIDKYLKGSPGTYAEEIYENLHEGRKKLVVPIIEDDEAYRKRWEEERYQGKAFYEGTPELYTEKGERVRSKSEVMIADLLNQFGIPYRYEYPLQLKGVGKIFPDFTILNIKTREHIYWEHFGMMDDIGYAETAIKKIAAYEQNDIFPGEHLIMTFETKKNPLNSAIVKNQIMHYLQ